MSAVARVGMADECRRVIAHSARIAVIADRDVPSALMANDTQEDCRAGGVRDHFSRHARRFGGSRVLVTR